MLHSWSILFLLYINDLPDCVICNIAIHADDTALHSKYLICGSNNCNWFLCLNLIYKDITHWSKKWPDDFNAGKT